jgi:phosphoserine phosphatase RsbU/P
MSWDFWQFRASMASLPWHKALGACSLQFCRAAWLTRHSKSVVGEIERLGATATVLGLFTKWNCEVKKVSLGPGDVLVIYTDGITEAPNQAGEEFGESRLLEIVRSNPQVQVSEMLSLILAEVQKFSGASQADDLTLVIARAQ